MDSNQQTNSNQETTKKDWYDKHYKLLLVIPIIVLVLSLAYIGYFYYSHKTIMLRDASLTGGTSITLNVMGQDIDSVSLEAKLKTQFTSKQAYFEMNCWLNQSFQIRSGINKGICDKQISIFCSSSTTQGGEHHHAQPQYTDDDDDHPQRPAVRRKITGRDARH